MWWLMNLIKSYQVLTANNRILSVEMLKQSTICLVLTKNLHLWIELGILQWQSKSKKERSKLLNSKLMKLSRQISWDFMMNKIKQCSKIRAIIKSSISMLQVNLLVVSSRTRKIIHLWTSNPQANNRNFNLISVNQFKILRGKERRRQILLQI